MSFNLKSCWFISVAQILASLSSKWRKWGASYKFLLPFLFAISCVSTKWQSSWILILLCPSSTYYDSLLFFCIRMDPAQVLDLTLQSTCFQQEIMCTLLALEMILSFAKDAVFALDLRLYWNPLLWYIFENKKKSYAIPRPASWDALSLALLRFQRGASTSRDLLWPFEVRPPCGTIPFLDPRKDCATCKDQRSRDLYNLHLPENLDSCKRNKFIFRFV